MISFCSFRVSSFPVCMFLILNLFFWTSSFPTKITFWICFAFAYSIALPIVLSRRSVVVMLFCRRDSASRIDSSSWFIDMICAFVLSPSIFVRIDIGSSPKEIPVDWVWSIRYEPPPHSEAFRSLDQISKTVPL